MSKIGKTLLMFAVGLLMTACSSVMAGGAVAPSGNTVSEEMSLGNFDKIVVNGSFEVTYETGNAAGAVVTGSDNLVPLVNVEVNDNTLSIGFKRGTSVSRNDVEVHVVAPSVTGYELNGSGDLSVVSTLKMPSAAIKAVLNGSGDIEFYSSVECQSFTGTVNGSGDLALSSLLRASKGVDLTVNGSGDIDADAVKCAELDAAVNGSGDLSVNTVEGKLVTTKLAGSGDVYCDGVDAASVVARLLGSGDINLGGKSASATFEVSTSGCIDAEELVADGVFATVSGSGDINCHALKTLEATINGSGEICYEGSPRVTKHGRNSCNVYRE